MQSHAKRITFEPNANRRTSHHDLGLQISRHPPGRTRRKRHLLVRDTSYAVKKDGSIHIVSEDYSYKSEPYYTILRQELGGENIIPCSHDIIDASIVPVCLERAKRANVPCCEWGISQGYVPLPAIIYGLNYFAATSDFFVARDTSQAKDIIRHVTNNGKYPFCYQHLPSDAEIETCSVIFGKVAHPHDMREAIAGKVYGEFPIPLFRMVLVKSDEDYFLSSLSMVKYSQLSEAERSILLAHVSHQEFL